MRTLLVGSLVAAALAATPAGAVGAAAPIAHPTAASRVVVRVSSGGGFVAPQANLSALPSFTLYGDGTVLLPGAVPQISPGPAISPLVRLHLGANRVQALLRRAKQAGLLAGHAIDYGDMGSVGVSDMPTTTVTLNAGGRHVQLRAYALGAPSHGGRLSDAQTRARLALTRFIASLPHGPGGTRYTPQALAVFVAPYSGQPQPGSTPIVWPLASDLATAGKGGTGGLAYRCISVRGADARTLLARLGKANSASRWRSRGATAVFTLSARPLLPDELGCASLTR